MKLTSLVSAFVLFFSMTATAQAVPASADEIIDESKKLATKENKNIFILFHASWCSWCHKMDKSMNDESCKKFFDDNFVIRHLVVDESDNNKHLENPGADAMKKKYHGDGEGIPFWLVFEKNGKLLADSKLRVEGEGPESGYNTGCPATEKEVGHFISVLKKTTSLHSDQLEIIRKRFRQNEY